MTYGIIIRDGTNTPRTVSEVQVRDGTNTPRDISEIWVRDSNNVPRLVFSTAPTLSAAASPESVFGYSNTGTATTDSTTVNVTGGTPPYTYAWTLELYDNPSAAPTCSAPTSASVTFTQTSIGSGESYSANWSCTVTDATSATTQATCNSFWTNLS